MKNVFLPYAHQSIDPADIFEVNKALFSNAITRGPRVEAFEKEIADYCGAKYAVAFSSASTALSAACHASQVDKHDRLISTPNTFISSVGCGVQKGATPIFVDIDRHTGNINLEQVGFTMQKPYSRGRHILLPVHFSGIAVDMRQLDSLITDPDTVVIEDAAHALGSYYPNGGPRVGSCEWSQMTVFSFHPAKTITTGEGGMVTTNDRELVHRLQRYRNNGIERDPQYLEGEAAPWYYECHEMTNNFNFTEIQAALGLSQLKRLEDFIAKRRQLVQIYRQELQNLEHVVPFTAEFDEHTSFHLFVVQIDFSAYKTNRTEVMNKLKDRGIGTQVHYIPVYRHPCFKNICGDISEYFPNMEAYYNQALSLPLYYNLRIEDVERVVRDLQSVLAGR